MRQTKQSGVVRHDNSKPTPSVAMYLFRTDAEKTIATKSSTATEYGKHKDLDAARQDYGKPTPSVATPSAMIPSEDFEYDQCRRRVQYDMTLPPRHSNPT